MGYHKTIESAQAMAQKILKDPEDEFILVAIIPGVHGLGGYDCYPLRYYDLCPGARQDTRINEEEIKSVLCLPGNPKIKDIVFLKNVR